MEETMFVLLLVLVGCNGGEVTSDEEAAYAYVGLDGAVSRALDLGLQGFNAAPSANIDTQTGSGDVSGTMTVDGQVDQGASDNKGLRLQVGLVDYADLEDLEEAEEDEIAITYDTIEGAPLDVDLTLRNTPDGTLEGTFLGDVTMDGDLEGMATLDLTLSGELQDDGTGATERAPGTTRVTGTVTNDGGGSFAVDVTI
jgi:hypothetical protein